MKMIKWLTLLATFYVIVPSLALVSDYSFSSTLGTYNEITGGTVLGTTANDDESFNAIPLGFTFTYNGMPYTEISIQTDAFIAFGPTVMNSTLAISSTTSTNNVIAALNRDLISRADGELSYLLTGTAPHRVLVVQWKNYRRLPTTAANDVFNFQIQLHENGNKVVFAYGAFIVVNVVTAATVQVGLRGDANTDFNNRTTTTDWTATTTGAANNANCRLTDTVFPSNGLIFTFDPVGIGIPLTDINAGLTSVYGSSAEWGDIDSDGDLDLFVNGVGASKVYRNDGSGIFTFSQNLGSTYNVQLRFGDYNNDGDLDILNSNGHIYSNNGNGLFTDLGSVVTGGDKSSCNWGDYDHDGDLDILLAGYNGTVIAKIYRNDGNSIFTDINAGLTGLYNSTSVWGDYDNDGDLDILLSGSGSTPYNTNPTTMMYRNDGNDTFTNIDAGLQNLGFSSAAWGDYDNDGWLDILLSGSTGYQDIDGAQSYTKIYHNNGNGTFTDINAGLVGVHHSATRWGDYDNDGDLDIMICGYPGVAKVYRNNGNNSFTDANAGLASPITNGCSTLAWGDYDNDGDLDILQTGGISKIYRNDLGTQNSIPNPPTNLSTSFNASEVIFQWDAASDIQTPAAGLNYVLRIGTTSGGTEISSPMAASSGYRMIPVTGYSQTTQWRMPISNYLHTTIYWSVQAIDTGLMGSAFAPEVQYFVGNSLSVYSTPSGAAIWKDGMNTGFTTPHVFNPGEAGSYTGVLAGFTFDTIVQPILIANTEITLTGIPIPDTWTLTIQSLPTQGYAIYKNGVPCGQVTNHSFTAMDPTELYGTYTLEPVAGFQWQPAQFVIDANSFAKYDWTATIVFVYEVSPQMWVVNIDSSYNSYLVYKNGLSTGLITPCSFSSNNIEDIYGTYYIEYYASITSDTIEINGNTEFYETSAGNFETWIYFSPCGPWTYYWYTLTVNGPNGYSVTGPISGTTPYFVDDYNDFGNDLLGEFTISDAPSGYHWEVNPIVVTWDMFYGDYRCQPPPFYQASINFVLAPNPTLTVISTPTGSDILIDSVDSGYDTPYTFANPVPGVYSMSPPYFNWVPQSVTIGTLTDDTTINFVADPLFLNVTSSPPGQAIYRNGLTTGHVTPYVFSSFSTQDLAGTYTLLAVPGAFWTPPEWVVTVEDLTSSRDSDVLGTAGSREPEYDYSIDFVLDYYTLTVTSDPSGAAIWKDGSYTGQITPYTFDPGVPGTYSVQLAGWSFTPNTHSVPVLDEDFAINFLGMPPLAPSALTATTISSSQINLAWTDNSANETGFKIERKTATGTWQQIATVGANVNAYNNTGLEQHTAYYYQVRAFHQLGDSGYSNEASATTLYATPNAPTNLTAAPVSSVRINLAWTDNSALETGFKIERKTGVSGSWSQIGTVGANVTTYSSTGLTQHTTYYYRVRAYNVDVNSAYSNEANATTFYATPAAPTNLTAVSPNCQQINISWTDNADNETAYYVERKIGETGSWTTIATLFANFTFYNNNFLAQHTTYYYRVRALNVVVYSDYSNEASATTSYCTPAAPTNLTAQAISSSQINLSWTENSAHETDIIIERKATAGGVWSEIAVLDSNSTSYSDTGLPHGITYYYRVRALNVEVYSPYSNEASATPVEPPTADFGSDVTVVLALDEVQFSDMSVPGSGSLVQWLWDFGDGNTSSLQNPAHAYQNAGTYTISLTVTNSFDSTAVVTKPNYIQVLPRTPQIALIPATALDFGVAYLGSHSTRELLIQNTGSATLNINSHSFKLPSSRFSLIWPTLPAQIPEGASLAIQLQFTPQVTGPVTDSLFIYNNSVNLPLAAIGLTGDGAIAAPRAPDNVSIAMNGNDAVITWSVVAQTIHDTPVTPDYYFVYNADDPYGAFTLLGLSSSLSYTHSYVGLGARCKFYRISAVKFYRDDLAEGNLDTWLKRNLVPGMSDDAVRKAIRDINRE